MKKTRDEFVDTSVKVSIEALLTGEFSRTSLKRFGGRRWLRIELSEGKPAIEQVRGDLIRTEQWKQVVMRALSGTEGDEKMKLANRWIGVIKLRIAALEKWSQLVGAVAAYLAGGCALVVAVVEPSFFAKTLFIVLGVCIGLAGGLFRYYIDRHTGSNKFVLVCLEAALKA